MRVCVRGISDRIPCDQAGQKAPPLGEGPFRFAYGVGAARGSGFYQHHLTEDCKKERVSLKAKGRGGRACRVGGGCANAVRTSAVLARSGSHGVRRPRAPAAQGERARGRRPFARIGGPSCCGKERVRLVLRGEEHLKRHLLDLVLQLLELVDVLVLVFEDVHEDVARGVVEHLAG